MTTADTRWFVLLRDVMEYGNSSSPRNARTCEKLGQLTVFNMSTPILSHPGRKLGYRFLAAEAWWLLSGENRVDKIAPYSRMISQFSDDGLFFKGAYGPKVLDQICYVADTLNKDPESRQAVLTIWRERPGPSRDIPCTISAQWMIRQGKLHCFVNMRSSDVWLGVPYDWFNFSMVSLFLSACLNQVRPLGNMYFNAASQHVYQYNFEQAEEVLKQGPKEGFRYKPIDHVEWAGRPFDIVDHLKALADLEKGGLKGFMFEELFDARGLQYESADDQTDDPRGLNNGNERSKDI